MSTVSVSKSIKLGLPQYSSVSFSASYGMECTDETPEGRLKAFKEAWDTVEYQLRDKLYPYKEHGLVKDGTLNVDPEWIDGKENEKKRGET